MKQRSSATKPGVFALLAGLLACSGPQTGTWRGSAEVRKPDGADAAVWTVQLHCGADRDGAESCRVDLQPPGEAESGSGTRTTCQWM